jgi:ribosome-binding factor A
METNFNLTFEGSGQGNSKSMETKRQKQINELLRRQFSMVLMEEGSYIFEKAMVTVTRAVVSPDLQNAKIYVSVFNTENKSEVMASLDEHLHQLRHALAKRVGKQLRRIPEIAFYLDESLDEYFRMEKILADLRANNQMGKEEE